MANITARWAAAIAAAPYFQTSEVPGYENCTTAGAFAAAHSNFGGPVCYNGSIPWQL